MFERTTCVLFNLPSKGAAHSGTSSALISFDLRTFWTPLRIVSHAGDQFDAEELIQHLNVGGLQVLSGPMGSGKSEVLGRAAAAVAAVAGASREAELPLWISARDLASVDTDSLRRSAERLAPGTGTHLERLLRGPRSRWIVFVDSVDEVPRGAERVEALRPLFPEATIIAASRPGVAPSMGGQVDFTIEPWSRSDAEMFIGAVCKTHPEAEPALRGLTERAAPVLERPLTAMLAAGIAVSDGEVPRNAAMLLRAVLPRLFESWASQREGAHNWRSIAPEVRRFALGCLRDENRVLSAKDVRRLARKATPDGSSTLQDAAEIQFGILVRGPDGFEFLFRGLADHLAAEELSRTDADILDAARQSWAAEATRQGLALVADDDPERFVLLVRNIIDSVRATPDGLGELRALAVAIRAIADVGDVADGLHDQIVDVCAPLLGNEASPWRGDVVAEAAVELAHRGGACWTELQD